MNEQLESIINSNLKNKQSLDLMISFVDTVQCLSSSDRVMAINALLNQEGLSNLLENLMNVSDAINDINGELSDLMEGVSND